MRQQIITVGAIKGGTGKTATAGALAMAAAHRGLKVLAVDLDPQASLSIWLQADLSKKTSYDVIEKGAAVDKAMQRTKTRNLHVICGGAALSALHTRKDSTKRLLTALLHTSREYDLIFIDTAPTIGEGLDNALYASTGLVMPVETDGSGIQALYQTMDMAERAQKIQPRLKTTGALVTQYDSRPNINRYMLDRIRETAAAANIPYLGEIRQSVAIREAMALQADLYEYAPKSKPALDYAQLLDTIIKKGGR